MFIVKQHLRYLRYTNIHKQNIQGNNQAKRIFLGKRSIYSKRKRRILINKNKQKTWYKSLLIEEIIYPFVFSTCQS